MPQELGRGREPSKAEDGVSITQAWFLQNVLATVEQLRASLSLENFLLRWKRFGVLFCFGKGVIVFCFLRQALNVYVAFAG